MKNRKWHKYIDTESKGKLFDLEFPKGFWGGIVIAFILVGIVFIVMYENNIFDHGNAGRFYFYLILLGCAILGIGIVLSPFIAIRKFNALMDLITSDSATEAEKEKAIEQMLKKKHLPKCVLEIIMGNTETGSPSNQKAIDRLLSGDRSYEDDDAEEVEY